MNAAPKLQPTALEQLVDDNAWLALDDGIVRCPLLIKGTLVGPPPVDRNAIERAFGELDRKRTSADPFASYVRIGDAQVLRHATIDRKTLRASGWVYRVMPCIDALALIERDIDALVAELYAMPHERALEWLRLVRGVIEGESVIVSRVRELERMTSEHPDAFVDSAFAAFPILLDEAHATAAIDHELGDRSLLDGWVELETTTHPGPNHFVGAQWLSNAFAHQIRAHKTSLRAMPTRQLHITAGNSPLIPLMSLLRAVWTKSPSVIKLPSGAALPGSLVALAAAVAAPDHPLTHHLSMVYWRGGDDEVERVLFAPNAFDRVVVWGEPDSVAAVKQRAVLTKTLTFNPRYAASFIGREAFAGDLDEVATRAVFDSMIENQKACIASLVHYVEGDLADAERYAAAVGRALARWDERAPQPLLDRHRGQLKRLARGLLGDAQVAYHNVDGEYQSGVVVAPHDFQIKDHPMCRLVVVRPVAQLEDCLGFLHHGVATIGVFPEARRLELRDRIAARGVSNVVPLGQSGCGAIGTAHDGMLVLSELVDWKNS
jgi:hypothetical protein